MKKIIAMILIICLFCETGVYGTTVSAGEVKENLIYGDYVYRDIVVGTCAVDYYNVLISYNGNETHLIVPDEINGVPVAELMCNYKYPNQIEKITLGKNMRHVNKAFDALPNLKAIEVAGESNNFSSIDGVLYDHSDLVRYPRGKVGTTYKVPEQISPAKKIGTTLVLPEKTERICNCAFYGCNNLQTIILPETVWDIFDEAFKNCENLKKISLPKSLMYIDKKVFSGCSSLQEIKIPKNVARIRVDAFENCNAKIKMPSYMKKRKMSDGKFYELRFKAKYKKKTKEYSFLNDFGDIKTAKKKVTLKKKKKRKLVTKIYVDDAWRTLKTDMLYFSSSNKKVATVTNNGMVKAKKKGKTTITGYYYFGGEITHKYKVKVKVK